MAYLLQPIAHERPQALALVDEQGRTTWAELDARVNRLIRALRKAGLQPGDRIALFAGNGRGLFELMAAAHHAGITYVPVNWHFTADELAYVLVDAGARALFTDTRFAAVARAALVLAPQSADRLRVCLDGSAEGFMPLQALVDTEADASEPADQAVGGPMFYTSGTTGRPKGVLRRAPGGPPALDTLRSFAGGLVQMLQLPLPGTTLLCGPAYHSAQWSFAFGPLLAGSMVVMTHRFDAAQTLALIDAHQVTNVHLVPTQMLRLLRLPADVRQAFSGTSLQRVWHGAAPCPPDVKRALIDWWGPCIHEYYGSTEGAVVTGIGSSEWLARPGSVGKPIGRVDVQVLRDDGSPAAPGEPGTIGLRNRNPVTLAYHNDPAKTAAAHLAPGLFTTGDVGYLDADGYLYLTDRKIDMIISGGVNIYPAEIEGVLAAHPAVQDVAVFGVPDAEFGEAVMALVQPVPGQVADDALVQALQAHCRERLAGYKLPRQMAFRDTLPRTESGKLQKRLLRDAYWKDSGRLI